MSGQNVTNEAKSGSSFYPVLITTLVTVAASVLIASAVSDADNIPITQVFEKMFTSGIVFSIIIFGILWLVLFLVLKIIFRKMSGRKTNGTASDIGAASSTKTERNSSGRLRTAVISAVIAVLLIATNPNVQDYANYVNSEMASGAKKQGEFEQGLVAMMGGFATSMLINSTTRSNYLLYSTYETSMGKNTILYVGVVGIFIEI